MKVTVAISTYNGSEYVVAQLDSILNQTKSPDEVLIRDDMSTDNTCQIIEEYIYKHKLNNWKLYVNEQNVGWKKNFINLFSEASGDLIFPCDQDDVWLPDKIESMTNIMEKESRIMVLEGQPQFWFMNEKKNGPKGWIISIADFISARRIKSKNTRSIKKKTIDKTFMRVWPGCVLCVRKSFFEAIKEEWTEKMPHDALISMFAKMNEAYYRYDKEVIKWRKHKTSSTSNVKKTSDNRLSEILRDYTIIKAVSNYAYRNHLVREMKIFEQAKKWNFFRKQLVTKWNIGTSIKLLFYLKFYVQKRRYISDVIYGISRKKVMEKT